LFPLLTAFYAESYGTRLRLLTEVYGGMWDALVDNRADLAIGAPGEGPAGGGFSTRPLGVIEFIFLVAPAHPLAALPGPLKNADLVKHRVVSAADSSRSLPPRTSGLISGQDVLTVPGIQSKIEAQRAALGVGYLPRHLARAEIEAGRLIPKTVEEPKPAMPVYLAWRTAHRGRALRWFLDHLDDAAVRDSLMN
jgi:DNA-binding transcriptional LysR family regulator